MKRYELINNILLFAGDEYETREDLISLAKLTKQELKCVINHFKSYESSASYRRYNSLKY
mgnify:CR=1 FL=1|jgi:hypothetical protein